MTKKEDLLELYKEVRRVQSLKKPSAEVFKYSDKLSKKVRDALDYIEQNNNTSWAQFMFERAFDTNSMDKIAIKYRGNKITYGELFTKAFEYCKALKAAGVKKGDQIPVCISNIPEYIYLLLACNFVGATIHLFGSWFDKEYLSSILNDTRSNIIFISEDNYEKISDVVEKCNIQTPVLISLDSSLKKDKNGKSYNPYQDIDGENHIFASRANEFKKRSSKNIITQDEFLESGKDYKGDVLESSTLQDIATISYTSGTTKKGYPKGVKHSNRVYISVARFKSPDVSGLPAMKNLTTQFEIPTYSHTNISNVTDTLYCNCAYACEPFNENEFFMKSLLINKPNYCQSPLGRWIYLGKELSKKENKHIKFPELMMPDVVGEGCGIGEEKFLNRVAREHQFGIKKLPFPLSPVTFSLGGGTCEGGGVFFTLFHEFQRKILSLRGKEYTLGLMPVKMVDYEVLNLDGDYCKPGEPGILVVNSPANMSGYTNENFNAFAYIDDKYGKRWLTMGTLAYKSDPKYETIKMKGRVNDFVILKNGNFFPTYFVEESISKDTKNIMSCVVIKTKDNDYICHLEMQPDAKKSVEETLKSCAMRLKNEMPEEILDRIYFRIRSYDEGFPLAESGKRDSEALKNECNSEKLIHIGDILDVQKKNSEEMSLKLTKGELFK